MNNGDWFKGCSLDCNLRLMLTLEGPRLVKVAWKSSMCLILL